MKTWFAPLLGALLASGCGPAPESLCQSTAECSATQACFADGCQEVECRSGADCAIESYCNTETFTCALGCGSSDDCLAGDRCDVETNTCTPRQCRDTQLDCSLAERCNAATGECERDADPHCRRCTSSEQCGPTGECGALRDNGPGFCFLECSPEAFDPCPAGLQCSAQIDALGNPAGFRCIGQCDGG